MPGLNLAELFAGNEFAAIDPAIQVLRAITKAPPDDTADTICLNDWFDGLRRYQETAFPKSYAKKASEIYARLSSKVVNRCHLHGDFHPANIVSATREPFLAIDPKGIIGPIGYDIAVFLNNFHWWHEERVDVRHRLDQAVQKFSTAFDIKPDDLRGWAFAQMVLSAWWTFDEMPETYQNEVVNADIWDI
jgi:streptomycin 6-kinase